MSNKCSERVYHDSWGHGSSCQRPATKEHGGKWYCATHHPDAVQARRDKQNAKDEARTKRAIEEANAKMLTIKRAALFGELVASLKGCIAQLEILLPKSGVTHDERQAVIAGNAVIAKAKELQ